MNDKNDEIYIKINNDGLCEIYYTSIHNNIPSEAIKISEEEKNNIIRLINIEKKRLYVDNNQILFRDRLTKYDEERGQWIADNESKLQEDKKRLISQAKKILAENDFRWSNQIKWSSYSDRNKKILTEYYNNLVAVVNGESLTLPVLEF